MDRQYIEGILKDDDIVKYISKLRTKFPLTMTVQNFFKIFFNTLKTVNITAQIDSLNYSKINIVYLKQK